MINSSQSPERVANFDALHVQVAPSFLLILFAFLTKWFLLAKVHFFLWLIFAPNVSGVLFFPVRIVFFMLLAYAFKNNCLAYLQLHA